MKKKKKSICSCIYIISHYVTYIWQCNVLPVTGITYNSCFLSKWLLFILFLTVLEELRTAVICHCKQKNIRKKGRKTLSVAHTLHHLQYIHCISPHLHPNSKYRSLHFWQALCFTWVKTLGFPCWSGCLGITTEEVLSFSSEPLGIWLHDHGTNIVASGYRNAQIEPLFLKTWKPTDWQTFFFQSLNLQRIYYVWCLG